MGEEIFGKFYELPNKSIKKELMCDGISRPHSHHTDPCRETVFALLLSCACVVFDFLLGARKNPNNKCVLCDF